jgi:RecA/RadA recombinase
MKLRDTIGKIGKTYGDQLMAQGSRGKSFKTRRFQSMVFDVDAAVGGGYPRGRFVLAYGPPSGGKSVLLYKALAGMQIYCRYCTERFKIDMDGVESCDCPTHCVDCDTDFVPVPYTGPKPTEDDPFDWELLHDEFLCECLVQPKGTKAKRDRVKKVSRLAAPCRGVLFDAERSYDQDWVETLGVDTSLMFVFVPEYAEQGIDIADNLLRSGEIDFLGVDSIAELVPGKEIETSTEEWQVGLQARLVNKGFRKWSATMNSFGVHTQRLPCIFVVNQIRESMMGETIPGGWMQRFKSSIMIRVNGSKGKFKDHGTGDDKIKELVYMDISGFTKKNKTYPAFKRYSTRLYVAGGHGLPCGSTNEYAIVRARAIETGVIAIDKSTSTKKYTYGGEVYKTLKAIDEAMKENYELFWEIRDEAMKRVVEAQA